MGELELIFDKKAETTFHDTVPVPAEHLEKHRKKAERQQDRILWMFRQYPTLWFTPYQIQTWYEDVYSPILITSVRRSITDLTNEGTGRLRKGSLSDQIMEKWGTNNNRWRYNPDFQHTINPQK